MRAFFRICFIVTAILIPGLLPMVSFGAGALKFRHLASIYSDEQNIALRQPEGAAVYAASQLIVADTANGRLLRYTFENRELASKTQEIRAPQIRYPAKVGFNSRGEIYVLDRKRQRIARMSPQGVFLNDLNLSGSSAAGTIVPRSFHIDRKDNIYVLDVLSGRVLVLDPAGQLRRQIKFPRDKYFFSDIAVDFKGDVFLVDGIKARIFRAARGSAKFTPLTESLKQFMRFPTNITSDSRGILYLTDRNGGKVVAIGQDGSYLGRLSGMGWKDGFLNYPSQVSINSKGEIFIADALNNRIQIFTIIE